MKKIILRAFFITFISITTYASDNPPRILVTNDDGIDSPGLNALVEKLESIGEVWVTAPADNQSGSGSSITFEPVQDDEGNWGTAPIRATRRDGLGSAAYAVEGTPADSVRFGLALAKEQGGIDLVVSGINKGSNLGEAVRLSGTIGAAMTAAARGIPSIAVSASTRTKDFEPSAAAAVQVANEVLHRGLPSGTLLSINVPFQPKPGIVTAPNRYAPTQRSSSMREVVSVGENGEAYYKLQFGAFPKEKSKTKEARNTDMTQYRQAGRITITPVRLDWTDYKTISELNFWDLSPINTPTESHEATVNESITSK